VEPDVVLAPARLSPQVLEREGLEELTREPAVGGIRAGPGRAAAGPVSPTWSLCDLTSRAG
jgi:hypothetical protein